MRCAPALHSIAFRTAARNRPGCSRDAATCAGPRELHSPRDLRLVPSEGNDAHRTRAARVRDSHPPWHTTTAARASSGPRGTKRSIRALGLRREPRGLDRRRGDDAPRPSTGFKETVAGSWLADRTKSVAYGDKCPDQANLKEERTLLSHNHTHSRAQ